MNNDILSTHVDQIMTAERWNKANRNLLAKMISEFTYEDMIHPIEPTTREGYWKLILNEITLYRFSGISRLMDSLYVDPNSVERWNGEKWEQAEDAIQFLRDIQQPIGLQPSTTAYLIKEYKHTLLADVHILEKKEYKTASDLIGMSYSEMEAEMEGHPWITYNKGRIGFSYRDYMEYAPEQKQMAQLYWIAVHKDIATFHAVPGIDHHEFVKQELRPDSYKVFEKVLVERGLTISDYFFIPVHSWQWEEVLIPFYAEELAFKNIVYLGIGDDAYLPQQSIRTFVNQDYQDKHHVKVPMSILNTLVYRGLPGERTVLAPEITQFIQGIRDQDSFLRDQCRVVLPGEVASINVDHPDYANLAGAPYQFLEMLGVIWRESIFPYLDEGEEAITLAALLYEDQHGKPYVQELIERSGLTTEQWIQQLFQVILPPLLHFLYEYGTVFSPHGQNTVIIMKDHKPHRLGVKDFVDDVNVSDQPIDALDELSGEMKKVLRSEPPEGLCQFIFTGLFVCHHRYLADILDRKSDLSEHRFWEMVRETILAYQHQFPHLQDRFELFDLLRPTFTKLCLNRNRMLDYGYEDGDDRPHASEYGKVTNPLHVVATKNVTL
ncbi:IucA/IucC family protein [Pontibacillus yanchengensis]|uniref:Iron transporter n=1 Tax=Pontibacillus yanchengensis Y32 TaxID=1385514 RepID=A0A0A2TS44_9BACI|nr:IucA/IucC family siderophore biosynthesis protein [Pontibacillus yanchengensis]KGP72090.1 iron transporter [Pontibacillus yanchengensis Y32]